MDSVNKTLYIPLYGKAYVSKKGLFLKDPKAEEIWEAEGFSLKGKAKSKWLAYYMGIRSAVFDDWVRQQLTALPQAVVIHIGCGMDSRAYRIADGSHKWYDVDFPSVIAERWRYFQETDHYQMLAGDARDSQWLAHIPETQSAIVVMEGVSMYLKEAEMQNLMDALSAHFERVALLVDCYTTLAAKFSKRRNPVNTVGVTEVYGIDDPLAYERESLRFLREHSMTPRSYIDALRGGEKFIFSHLYAGSLSKKLYRLFEYQK